MRLPFAPNVAFGFAAGAAGAVLLVVLFAGLRESGLLARLGLGGTDPTELAFIYRSVTWGGLWGLLFAVPILRLRPLIRGVLVGSLATLALLMVFFPLQTTEDAGPGFFGLNVGPQLPAFAFVMNWFWGVCAALIDAHLKASWQSQPE